MQELVRNFFEVSSVAWYIFLVLFVKTGYGCLETIKAEIIDYFCLEVNSYFVL